MRIVWKYQLSVFSKSVVVNVPKYGILLDVGNDPSGSNPNVVCVWIDVKPGDEVERREFAVIGTGDPIPPSSMYVGTVINEPYAWHVFEVLS